MEPGRRAHRRAAARLAADGEVLGARRGAAECRRLSHGRAEPARLLAARPPPPRRRVPDAASRRRRRRADRAARRRPGPCRRARLGRRGRMGARGPASRRGAHVDDGVGAALGRVHALDAQQRPVVPLVLYGPLPVAEAAGAVRHALPRAVRENAHGHGHDARRGGHRLRRHRRGRRADDVAQLVSRDDVDAARLSDPQGARARPARVGRAGRGAVAARRRARARVRRRLVRRLRRLRRCRRCRRVRSRRRPVRASAPSRGRGCA